MGDAVAQAAALADLAALKINEGDVGGAQELLQQSYELQRDRMAAEEACITSREPSLSNGMGGHVPTTTTTAAAAAAAAGSPAPTLRPDASPSGAAAGASPGNVSAAPSCASFATAASQQGGGEEGSGDEWDWESAPPIMPLPAAAPPPDLSRQSSGSDGGGACASTSGGGGSSSKPRGRGASKFGPEPDDWEALEAARQQLAPGHILEAYGLTRKVTTGDLEQWLADFHWGGIAPIVRWVDDEHALLVFPCEEAAKELLAAPRGRYRARPMAQASAAALEVPREELAPPRGARPKTTTAVARRLIGHALGNSKLVRDKEAEKELADMRRAKKEERAVRAAAIESAWAD